MNQLVVDASAVAPFLFADEREALLPELDEALEGGRVVVPAHWRLEVANMVLVALRGRRISDANFSRIMKRLKALTVEIDSLTNSEAWEGSLNLAGKHTLTAYDAAYLELAKRRDLPLATHDKALIRAAPTENVSLFGR